MKNKLFIIGIVLISLIALISGLSLARVKYRPNANQASAANGLLHIYPNGFFRAEGTVSNISQSNIDIQAWGIDIGLNISSSTKIVRKFGGKISNLSEIQNGDTVEISGMVSSTNPLTVNATWLKDLSVQERHATFYGDISDIVDESSFILNAKEIGRITVGIDQNTVISVNGKHVGAAGLQNGQLAVVSGIWDRQKSSLKANVIKARAPRAPPSHI